MGARGISSGIHAQSFSMVSICDLMATRIIYPRSWRHVSSFKMILIVLVISTIGSMNTTSRRVLQSFGCGCASA